MELYVKAQTRSKTHYFSSENWTPTAILHLDCKISCVNSQNVCHSQILIKNLLIKKLKTIDNSANLKNILPELSAKILATAFTPFRAIVFLD